MSKARFFFDECLSHRVVNGQLTDSLSLFGSSAEITHLFSKFPPGVADTIWIPQLAAEGCWIVITCDRGKHSKKSESLPLICKSYSVTHVTLFDGIDGSPLMSRCLVVPMSRRDLAEPMAKRAMKIARAEGMDGKPLKSYLELVKQKRNNFRAVLQHIEAGGMLD